MQLLASNHGLHAAIVVEAEWRGEGELVVLTEVVIDQVVLKPRVNLRIEY